MVYAFHDLKFHRVLGHGRMEPLAATTVPVLAWRCGIVKLWRIHPSDVDVMQWIPNMANLPDGFRALLLETSYFYIVGAPQARSAVLAQADNAIVAAAELCRYLAAAPFCYDDLRLVPDPGIH